MNKIPLRDKLGKFSTLEEKSLNMRVTEYEKQVILDLRNNYTKERCHLCKGETNLVGIHIGCLEAVAKKR